MSWSLLLYIFSIMIIILAIFVFFLGKEKIIKIILWNYVIWLTILWLSMCFATIVWYLENSQISIFWANWKIIWNIIRDIEITINVFLYIGLLLIIIMKSSIEISLPTNIFKKKLITILLVPMAIISLFISIQIAIFGKNIFDINTIQKTIQNISNIWFLDVFLYITPFILFLHWLTTLWMISQIDISSDMENSD